MGWLGLPFRVSRSSSAARSDVLPVPFELCAAILLFGNATTPSHTPQPHPASAGALRWWLGPRAGSWLASLRSCGVGHAKELSGEATKIHKYSGLDYNHPRSLVFRLHTREVAPNLKVALLP